MGRQIVKQLKGRERDLVTSAAVQLGAAVEQIEQAKADGLIREQHFNSLLEIITGEEQTMGLTFDLATGEVYREKPDEAPPKSRRRRRASSKSKNGAR